jgi:hypothetical protein
MAVTVNNSVREAFEASAPKALFENSGDPFDPFDVSKDGRFLIRLPVETVPAPVTVIVNWPAALH